jgi:hypothetical protein
MKGAAFPSPYAGRGATERGTTDLLIEATDRFRAR